jgi:hypothetical protein
VGWEPAPDGFAGTRLRCDRYGTKVPERPGVVIGGGRLALDLLAG